MIRRAAAIALALAATPAAAGGLDLTDDARAAFGAEVRALLLDEPGIVAHAFEAGRPQADAAYAEEASRDRALIRGEAPWLFRRSAHGFGAARPDLTIAVFVSGDCPDCAAALRDLRGLVRDHPGLRIELRPLDTAAATVARLSAMELFGPEPLSRGWQAVATLPDDRTRRILDEAVSAERLGLDMAPSYVFPDMIVRGHVPPVVLERYIGQY